MATAGRLHPLRVLMCRIAAHLSSLGRRSVAPFPPSTWLGQPESSRADEHEHGMRAAKCAADHLSSADFSYQQVPSGLRQKSGPRGSSGPTDIPGKTSSTVCRASPLLAVGMMFERPRSLLQGREERAAICGGALISVTSVLVTEGDGGPAAARFAEWLMSRCVVRCDVFVFTTALEQI